MEKLSFSDKSGNSNKAAGHDIEIIVFTDPLCCWSWAFNPKLLQLKKELGDIAIWDLKMGGLISTWDNFHDEINAVSRPAQMGPVWMHAGQMANMPIHYQIWMKDPPGSSYPACIAVKAVQLQSLDFAEVYLQLLRDACMGKGKNIAWQSVLYNIAEDFAESYMGFDIARFKCDYECGKAMEAFRSDLHLVSRYNITRFPTLIVKSRKEQAIILSGYKHYDEVAGSIETFLSGLISQTVITDKD